MFANFKKMLIMIPCMVFGLFLFTNAKVSAVDAVLLDSNKVIVGEESKENTYYFTNDKVWEFQADFNLLKQDTFLKYRVIRPDGKATAWSGKQYYVNNNGKFNISDYTSLSYTETVDVSTKVSVAPASTYYVEIDYYSEWLGMFPKSQNKNEILKVVVGSSDDNLNIPTASIAYDSASKKYTVNASVLKDGMGYSVITDIEYYFSDVKKENNTTYDFYKNKNASSVNGALEFTSSSEVGVDFDGSQEEQHKYLYVIVTTANGYSKIVEYSVETGSSTNGDSNVQQESNTNTDTGLFDYDFGELILLVLVVVLIVSCVLIITQKIVDYKKRLY